MTDADTPQSTDALAPGWTPPAPAVTKRGHTMEAEDYAAVALRFVNRLAWHCGTFDPAGLAHMEELADALDRARNIVIAAERAKPKHARMYSDRELGAIMGVSHTAVQKRGAIGQAVIDAAAPNIVRRRELTQRRAEILQRAGVEDLRATGTDNVTPLRRQA